MPVIDVITWDVSHLARRESFFPDEMSTINLENQADFSHYDPEPDVTVLFLPLPAKFNFATSLDWHLLSIQIEKWLVLGVSMELQYWAWGHDMFWLMFVTTYPVFPRGK
ncbi:hypothetical protein HD554DRAFT_2042385 [Boletus coccyginus]|nr:hypothetical protein HD554DRAFT_2042385 [Boletus coccyginus]